MEGGVPREIEGEEPDDPAWAPESGQPVGGRDDPWEVQNEPDPNDPAGAAWPPPAHATPKEEF